MIQLQLSGDKGRNKYALIDEADYPLVSKYKWYFCEGYARTARGIFMHRLIMSPKNEMTVDHLNHNRLDNRRKNLRVCSLSDNLKNKKGKGYFWDNIHRYWAVRVNGVHRCYRLEEEAKEAVRLIRSGKIPEKRGWGGQTRRPKNISRNRLSGYFFQCRFNGITYRKYGFKTIKEALEYRDNFYKEKNIC